MVKHFPYRSFLVLLTMTAGLLTLQLAAQDVGADTVVNLPTPAGVRIIANLGYAEESGPQQKLDLYLPFPMPAKPLPVIVYLHGGGWQKGSKADGRRLAFRLVAEGYAVACVDYRLSSEAQFPAQISDCRTAVRWLRDHATRYRLDSSHFGVVGVSAGGYLAALLGTAHGDHLLDSPGDLSQSIRVQAVCIFFGPIDLLQLYDYAEKRQTPQADEVVKLLGGNPRLNPEPARLANPLTYLQEDAPPFLLVHGLNDTVVPPEQSRLLYDALASRKIPVHLHLIHDAGHTGPAFVAPEINAMMDDFFSRALKLPPGPPDPITAVLTEGSAQKN